MSVAAQTIITDALIEIGVVPEMQQPAPEDSARCLRILNRDIMEPWSVQRVFATGRVFTTGTYLANQATMTIGPTGNFATLTFRPSAILGAVRVDSNALTFPVTVRDAEWYNALPNPAFIATLITDLYPTFGDPDLPNVKLYGWPIPSINTTLRLETITNLTQFPNLNSAINLAPGYESAIAHTAKELFSMAFKKAISDELKETARKARGVVQVVNLAIPQRIRNDNPGTMAGRAGSDPSQFKTRDF